MATRKANPEQVLLDHIARDFMNQVAVQVEGAVAERLAFWARNIHTNMSRKDELETIHRNVMLEARNRILTAYEKNHGRTSYRHPDPYRYSGGAMFRALSDMVNYKSTHAGFSFIDITHMDEQAEQWYGLNFGYGARGKTTPRAKNKNLGLRFGSDRLVRTNLKISLAHKGSSDTPRPMPMGLFNRKRVAQTAGQHFYKKGSAAKSGAFYRTGARGSRNNFTWDTEHPMISARRNNKGFKGTNFLNAGITFINRSYARKLDGLFDRWMKAGR